MRGAEMARGIYRDIGEAWLRPLERCRDFTIAPCSRAFGRAKRRFAAVEAMARVWRMRNASFRW